MHPRDRYKVIPEVYLVLIRDGKILLSHRHNTGWMDGYWGLPGGHGEEGETVREGAAREGVEELGTTLKTEDLSLIHVQCRWSPNTDYPHARIGYYFIPTRWDGVFSNKEPDKCADVEFFPITHLPENTIPQIRAAIECIHRKEPYGEFAWDTHE